MSAILRMALPKGRLLPELLALLAAAGHELPGEEEAGRRLRLVDATGELEVVLVKDADVPVYVEHGGADCGVAGSDVLAERGADVLTPLAFTFGACRFCVIARQGAPEGELWQRGAEHALDGVRIATKYPRWTAQLLAARGLAAEIVPLSGSVELAPVLGLTELVTDLVASGRTLAENGLVELETLAVVTPRFAVNRASWRLKSAPLRLLVRRLEAAAAARAGTGVVASC